MSLAKFFQVQQVRLNVKRKVNDPLVPGLLYIINDGHKNEMNGVEASGNQAVKRGSESYAGDKLPMGFPEKFFTEVHHLDEMPMSDLMLVTSQDDLNMKLSNFVLQCDSKGDLQKLQNFDFVGASGQSSTSESASTSGSASASKSASGEIFIAVRENWNFDAVKKLPWKLHNQGLTPVFFDANRNLNWKKEWKVLKRLNIKGVVMPVDLLAMGCGRRKGWNRLNLFFGGGGVNSEQLLSAVYLLQIQPKSPYYIYQSEIATWNAWVMDGKLNLVF